LWFHKGRLRRTFDQRFVGDRLDGDGLLQEAVEELATAARFATIEPERNSSRWSQNTTGCGYLSQINTHLTALQGSHFLFVRWHRLCVLCSRR